MSACAAHCIATQIMNETKSYEKVSSSWLNFADSKSTSENS